MQRALATRLEKLERRNKPEDGVFFLVWGSDRAGADKAVDAAREAGKIGDDDIVIAEIWPTELEPREPRPESRWILKNSGRKGLSDDEGRILLEIMFAEVEAGQTKTKLPSRALAGFGRKRVQTDWSAEELYAVGLGRLVTSREDRSHLHM
jgi:hypothetical protein